MGFVGNGAASLGVLLASQHVATRANIALLSEADNADYSCIDENFQPESLQTWGKRACVINAQMLCYRESVLKGLEKDGYTIIDVEDIEPLESEQVFESVKAASLELHTSECRAVEAAEDISDSELKKLKDKRAKTTTERQQERKAVLKELYGIEVTTSLVWKDSDGWYPQLRLHYFLTLGREHLAQRDVTTANAQIDLGENAVWKPDFNRGQLLPVVLLLENLNISYFLTLGVMFRGSDPQLQQFKALAVQHRYIIRNYLGVSISNRLGAITIVQKILSKLGLKLSYVGRFGSRGHRERVYKFIEPKDERDIIFATWEKRYALGVQH